MESDFVTVSNYLNTSLDCLRNNYNRHCSSNAQKGLNLLQPISVEMNEAFTSFQNGGLVSLDELIGEKVVIKRYVRQTLDQTTNEHEFKTWKQELERYKTQNSAIPSYEELYNRLNSLKRKEM